MGGHTMLVTLTWGDILVHVLIALGIFIVGAIFTKYIPPLLLVLVQRLSDFWASIQFFSGGDRRSKKRIKRLREKLTKYDDDFADGTLFFCRVMFKFVFLMSCGVIAIIFIGLTSLQGVAITLNCVISNSCQLVDMQRGERIAIYLYVSGIFAMVFVMGVPILTLELSPEKYLAQLKNRIYRLQKKLPPDFR
jgi:hypothetical protein